MLYWSVKVFFFSLAMLQGWSQVLLHCGEYLYSQLHNNRGTIYIYIYMYIYLYSKYIPIHYTFVDSNPGQVLRRAEHLPAERGNKWGMKGKWSEYFMCLSLSLFLCVLDKCNSGQQEFAFGHCIYNTLHFFCCALIYLSSSPFLFLSPFSQANVAIVPCFWRVTVPIRVETQKTHNAYA